jgi:hypothetical protein
MKQYDSFFICLILLANPFTSLGFSSIRESLIKVDDAMDRGLKLEKLEL